MYIITLPVPRFLFFLIFWYVFSRDERRKFITAKYADKQFSLSSDEVDLGAESNMESDSSSDEEKDNNILSEVT